MVLLYLSFNKLIADILTCLSRFGQPSILASSGELTSDTESASLSITPVENIVADGPPPFGSPGYTVTRPHLVDGFPTGGFDIDGPKVHFEFVTIPWKSLIGSAKMT